MFTREELLLLQEELIKASDRIKSGKRINRKTDLSNAEIHALISRLANDKKMPASARKKLEEMRDSFKELADKDAKIEAMRRAGPPLEVGTRAAKQKAEEEAHQAKVDEWMSRNTPKQIKELGHAEQYKQDTESPKMRSKSATRTSGSVRERMATGEGIAIPNKKFGEALDIQRQVQAKAEKIKAAKGPESVIRIPAEHNDEVVQNLKKLKQISPEYHHPVIDAQIQARIEKLKGAS